MDDPLGRQLLLIAILILINAFFAAAEIAVISLNSNKIRREAEEGAAAAKKMLRLVEKPTQFLSTIQIVITLAGFLASAFAADTFAARLVNWLINGCGWTVSESLLRTLSLIAITVILSYFTLVLGELVPKRIAMAKAEQVTRLTCGVVIAAGVLFRPLVGLLPVPTNGILRLLHINPNAQTADVSEDEIRLMVDIGEERGNIEPTEKEMIDNIFAFNDITAADVMVHRPDMKIIWTDDTPEQIVATIRETGLSRFPVCGEDVDDVRGILFTREYLLAAQEQAPDAAHLQQLLRDAYFVPETVAADVLLREMQKRKTHLAIVIDEYGATAGLVTMEDLLEEIVGNIYDEYDREEDQAITRIGDNLWRISGSAPVEEVWAALEMSEETSPDDDLEIETLGGLVYSLLNEIPADGDHPLVEGYGLRIRVDEIVERRVEWATVSKLPPPTEQEE